MGILIQQHFTSLLDHDIIRCQCHWSQPPHSARTTQGELQLAVHMQRNHTLAKLAFYYTIRISLSEHLQL